MFQCHPAEWRRVWYYLWYDMLFAFGTLAMVTLMVLMRCACSMSGENGIRWEILGDSPGKLAEPGTAGVWVILQVRPLF